MTSHRISHMCSHDREQNLFCLLINFCFNFLLIKPNWFVVREDFGADRDPGMTWGICMSSKWCNFFSRIIIVTVSLFTIRCLVMMIIIMLIAMMAYLIEQDEKACKRATPMNKK